MQATHAAGLCGEDKCAALQRDGVTGLGHGLAVTFFRVPLFCSCCMHFSSPALTPPCTTVIFGLLQGLSISQQATQVGKLLPALTDLHLRRADVPQTGIVLCEALHCRSVRPASPSAPESYDRLPGQLILGYLAKQHST